jgi:hypothetical protein
MIPNKGNNDELSGYEELSAGAVGFLLGLGCHHVSHRGLRRLTFLFKYFLLEMYENGQKPFTKGFAISGYTDSVNLDTKQYTNMKCTKLAD